MNISELKIKYRNLLQPIFGEQFRIDDSEEGKNWVVIILDGKQEEFCLSLYGIDCAHLYWCNECFIFNKNRNDLVSSDTYGEIVFEEEFDVEQLPCLIFNLILQLKDCTFIAKEEIVKGKISSGYDDIKDYIITAKTQNVMQANFQLANIAIRYIV